MIVVNHDEVTVKSIEIVPRGGQPLKMGGPPLEFMNIQPKNGGSASRIHQHQPKNGGPPLGTISMDLAVLI